MDRIRDGDASILFVGAHPDDEGILGPLLVRACKDYGDKCAIATFTRGEKGCFPNETACGRPLAKIRTNEYRAVAKRLGARPFLGDFEDGSEGGDLRGSPEKVIANWNRHGDPKRFVRKVLAKTKPNIVITLEPTHGMYGHPDHRAAAMLVMQVLREQPAPNVTLYFAINRYASVLGDNLDPLPVTDEIPTDGYSTRLRANYRDYFLEASRLYKSQHYYEGVPGGFPGVGKITENRTWLRRAD